MPLSVVLDACVLHPFHLVDTLLQCADANLYQPLWSRDILIELRRSLIQDAHRTEQEADRRIDSMTKSFPDSLVAGYQPWIPLMQNHRKDRHVLAAALYSGAELIVTSNLKHFASTALAPLNLNAQSPDAFLCELFASDQDIVTFVIQHQAATYRKPAVSVVALLSRLEKTVPLFSSRVRAHLLAEQL